MLHLSRLDVRNLPSPGSVARPGQTPAFLPVLGVTFQQLKAKSERLRLEFLQSELDLSCTIAAFPAAGPCCEMLVEKCYRTAVKGYATARAMILKDAARPLPPCVEQKLAQLHTALSVLRPAERRLDDERKRSSEDLPAAAAPPVRISPDNSSQSNAHELTRREIEVLKCIADGHSTKQVAGLLKITFKTAACHRYNLMDKLGIHDTATLIRYAIRNGIIQA